MGSDNLTQNYIDVIFDYENIIWQHPLCLQIYLICNKNGSRPNKFCSTKI